MNNILTLAISLNLLGIIFSSRRHNNGSGITKIIQKIKPNSQICNEQNCPPNRGTCSSENICYCHDGYISTYETPTLCDYEQKDRTLYFILEFLPSFGMGHFYVGNYILGIIKFVSYLIIFGAYFGKYHKKRGIDAARVRLFIFLLFVLWQVVDGLFIFWGIYQDGKDKDTGFKYF